MTRPRNGHGGKVIPIVDRRRRSTAPVQRTSSVPHAAGSLGVAEWFRPGERERAERVLADLAVLGIRDLRTGISWADWFTPEGQGWYAWLLPRLAREVRVLPCVGYTPPSLGIEPKTASPPRRPRDFADWLDGVIDRHGDCFEHIELWNQPNSLAEWDVRLDPDWSRFVEMIGCAAQWARRRGKKVVLGGTCPLDTTWLATMRDRGLLDHVDAVAVHGFPGTIDVEWHGYERLIGAVRRVLADGGVRAQVWITAAGFSTWRHDEGRQLRELTEALESGADRVYWYSLHDLDPSVSTRSGFHVDEREYHYGLARATGEPKLAFRLWADGGLPNLREHAWLAKPRKTTRASRVHTVITGGAGFIGTNLAHRLLERGESVVVLDNLSRPGVERNIRWLREIHGDRVRLELGDVRDPYLVRDVVVRARRVFHFAAQVAVTLSLRDPLHDFEVNGRGTMNLLEALRRSSDPPSLVFTSTNKVYGALPDVDLRLSGKRYEPCDPHLRAHGVGEDRPLDFHSPYGCSKGLADQYIVDYARTFDLPATVFRMSCIYGPRQFGNEEQGWVAHFLSQAMRGLPLTIYGDGKQVRDVLFVDDLVEAFLLASDKIESVAGEAFNVGGGPDHTLSLLELVDAIESMIGQRPTCSFDDWRPGDQRYYVSDYRKLQKATGWRPVVSVDEGLERLSRWLHELGGASKAARRASIGDSRAEHRAAEASRRPRER